MHSLLLFMSMFFGLYHGLEKTFGRYLETPIVRAPIIAQTGICITHTYTIIIAGFFYNYLSNVLQESLHTYLTWFSIAYFSHDIGFVLIKDRSQWMFIFHHLFAISLLRCFQLGYINKYLMVLYFFYLELSNALLAIWDLVRKYKTINDSYYNALTPYMITFFVPIRLGIIPVLSALNIIYATHYQVALAIPYLALAVMSIVYSIKLIKILKYKLRTVSNLTHYSFYIKDIRWVGNATNLAKLFINLGVFMHLIPGVSNQRECLLFILGDTIHTISSAINHTSFFYYHRLHLITYFIRFACSYKNKWLMAYTVLNQILECSYPQQQWLRLLIGAEELYLLTH